MGGKWPFSGPPTSSSFSPAPQANRDISIEGLLQTRNSAPCVSTLRNRSLFRGGGGLVQIGEGSMIFMQEKKGGNLCMHIGELCYAKGG